MNSDLDLDKEAKRFYRAILKLLRKNGEEINFENKTIAWQISALWVKWLQIYSIIFEVPIEHIPRFVDALYKIDLIFSEKLNLLKITPKMRKKAKIISKNGLSKNRKEIIEKLGGKCQICGYDKKECLEIHHIFPESRETSPVILLCPNCHKEVHKGLLTIENEKT